VDEQQWAHIAEVAAILISEPKRPGTPHNEYSYTAERLARLAITVDRLEALGYAMQAAMVAIHQSRAAQRSGLGVPARFLEGRRRRVADHLATLAMKAVSAIVLSDLISVREFANQYLPFGIVIPPIDVIVEGKPMAIRADPST
jgi:hypothetical protein